MSHWLDTAVASCPCQLTFPAKSCRGVLFRLLLVSNGGSFFIYYSLISLFCLLSSVFFSFFFYYSPLSLFGVSLFLLLCFSFYTHALYIFGLPLFSSPVCFPLFFLFIFLLSTSFSLWSSPSFCLFNFPFIHTLSLSSKCVFITSMNSMPFVVILLFLFNDNGF